MYRILLSILLLCSVLFSESLVQSVFNNYQSTVVRVRNINNDTEIGFGTGFIVSENGVIVTNYHVVEGAERVEVITIDDEK